MASTAQSATKKQDPARSHQDPNKWRVIPLMVVFMVTLPVLVITIVATQPKPPAPAWSVEAAALGIEPYQLALGAATYKAACALCHGPDGQGVARLGKPLRNSAFVQDHTDEQLFDLIAHGRMPNDPENTTGTLMPARGGQGITDDRVHWVVAYLRVMQDPAQPHASVEAWNLKKNGEETHASGVIAGGVGHDLFVASCAACHGVSGEGVDGLGKPLDASAFVDSKTDKELITFIKMGRPIWDAENTTGLDMPPKGGNPAITDEQLADIVTFIRSLHE